MKVIVSDFDLTLYRSTDELIKTIPYIKEFQKAGNMFIIATGRSLFSLKSVLDGLVVPFDYLILCNGALILDKNYNVLKAFEINKDILRVIANKCLRKDIKMEFTGLNDEINRVDELKQIYKMKIKTSREQDVYPIKKEIMLSFKEHVNAFIIPVTDGGLIDIVSAETNKAKAIQFLMNKDLFTDVKVIGDSENDVEMIRQFNGYAISSAKKEALEVSTKVYDSVIKLIIDVQ